MSDTDPTMKLIESLDRGDQTEWGRIVKGVPIFVEHDGYEEDLGEGRKKLTVVPKGERPPANARLLYSVDAARLQEVVAAINQNYDEWGKPIKLFLGTNNQAGGHSDPKVAQTANPEIVGFGRRAYLGTFGPRQRLAVKTDAFYKPGCKQVAVDYPERSPEFLPRTNAITGVALLKTDPRLPMGMIAFGADHETLYYGVGFMADENEAVDMADDDKSKETPAPEPGKKPAPPADEEEAGGDDEDLDEGDGELPPLEPHEVKFASRMLKYAEENHPAFKYLCGEHKKFMDTQAAMAAPSATDGNLPTSGDDDKKKPKPEERVDMAQTDADRLAALEKERAEDRERIAALEIENATMYANEALATLEGEGIVIKEKPKEVKKLVELKTLEARQERLQEIRLNYARAERSPARSKSWLPIEAGNTEGADDAPAEAPDAAELLRYADENSIDITTEAGLKKAMAALTKKA